MIAEVLALGTDVERWRGEATAARAEITGAVDRLAARVQGDEKVGSQSPEGLCWVADLLMGATSSELQQLAVCAGSLEAVVGVGGQDCTVSRRPTYRS